MVFNKKMETLVNDADRKRKPAPSQLNPLHQKRLKPDSTKSTPIEETDEVEEEEDKKDPKEKLKARGPRNRNNGLRPGARCRYLDTFKGCTDGDRCKFKHDSS